MNKYILISFVLIFIMGCTKCDEDINYLLTDFEKSLIPFNIATTNNFITESDNIVLGTYAKKTNKIIDLNESADEKCSFLNVEKESSILKFSGLNIKGIEIYAGKVSGNKTVFSISSVTDDIILPHVLDNCDGIVSDIQQFLTDFEISGFQFADVYVFNSCSENSIVSRTLYSSTNGVEFIEFRSGSYLKLQK